VPHAAKELRMNLGFIPALWAGDGDCVLVDDVQYAVKAYSRSGMRKADVLFLSADRLKDIVFDEIVPWGWDRRVRTELADAGVSPELLPDEDSLCRIRSLSSRLQTVKALRSIRAGVEDETCGESCFCSTSDRVYNVLGKWHSVVAKAPWSSSGRGLRYIDGTCSISTAGWLKNVVLAQGGVMLEPYYNKVKDFGLEFYSHGDGRIDYCGISVFDTLNGAYTGNIVSDEDYKLGILRQFVSEELINIIKQNCVRYFEILFRNKYKGPFGVDMMIVARGKGGGFVIHPCVEINLRMTMGHVALSLSSLSGSCVMRVVHDVNYQLRLVPFDKHFVKTL